jgi:hypothetical protein
MDARAHGLPLAPMTLRKQVEPEFEQDAFRCACDLLRFELTDRLRGRSNRYLSRRWAEAVGSVRLDPSEWAWMLDNAAEHLNLDRRPSDRHKRGAEVWRLPPFERERAKVRAKAEAQPQPKGAVVLALRERVDAIKAREEEGRRRYREVYERAYRWEGGTRAGTALGVYEEDYVPQRTVEDRACIEEYERLQRIERRRGHRRGAASARYSRSRHQV